jgi:hypothetical protein
MKNGRGKGENNFYSYSSINFPTKLPRCISWGSNPPATIAWQMAGGATASDNGRQAAGQASGSSFSREMAGQALASTVTRETADQAAPSSTFVREMAVQSLPAFSSPGPEVVVKVNETSDWNTTRSWAIYRCFNFIVVSTLFFI